jgi:hypothetical protein
MRAWYRMFYAGRMSYVDWHPGNFLFMEGRKLGVIDFGCMQQYNDAEWELMQQSDKPLTSGRPEERREFVKRWLGVSEEAGNEELLRLAEEMIEWSWRGRSSEKPYDFGDARELRRGLKLSAEFLRKRYVHGQACQPLIMRWDFAYRTFLYRLGARVDLARLAEEEVRVTGWQRDYAKR